jgi:hypothetical protein
MTDDKLEQVERDLAEIKLRNARVDANKAWEVSSFRIVCICAITYIVAAALLWFIGAEHFWLGALVPTVGFFLSSRSLPAVKRWWIESHYSK